MQRVCGGGSPFATQNCFSKSIFIIVLVFVDLLSLSCNRCAISCWKRIANQSDFFKIKFQKQQILNELWIFTVEALALFTHFNFDRTINVLLLTGCLVAKTMDLFK